MTSRLWSDTVSERNAEHIRIHVFVEYEKFRSDCFQVNRFILHSSTAVARSTSEGPVRFGFACVHNGGLRRLRHLFPLRFMSTYVAKRLLQACLSIRLIASCCARLTDGVVRYYHYCSGIAAATAPAGVGTGALTVYGRRTDSDVEVRQGLRLRHWHPPSRTSGYGLWAVRARGGKAKISTSYRGLLLTNTRCETTHGSN